MRHAALLGSQRGIMSHSSAREGGKVGLDCGLSVEDYGADAFCLADRCYGVVSRLTIFDLPMLGSPRRVDRCGTETALAAGIPRSAFCRKQLPVAAEMREPAILLAKLS